MKIKTRLFFILTLLIVSSLSILPCFAQSAASTQLKNPEYYGERELVLHNVVFSPDGRTIIGGHAGPSVHFWDVSTGEVIRTIDACGVNNIALSPDGHTLVSVSHERDSTCVWNASTGVTPYTLVESWDEGNGLQVNDIAFSPDGRTIANGIQRNPTGDGLVRLWNASTGKTIHKLEHPSNVLSVAFSPDGQTLASSSLDGTRFWDVSTGALTRTIPVPGPGTIGSLAFSSDGRTLAIARSGIALRDVSTGAIISSSEITVSSHWSGARLFAFSPCRGMLASAGSDEIIYVWDVPTGKLLDTFEGHTSSNKFKHNIMGIAFSQDGGTLLSVNMQGTVLRWNMVPCEPERLPEDVNGDGVVDIRDLVEVAAALGETGDTPADVNGDGIVNIQDLVQVAGRIGAGAAAP